MCGESIIKASSFVHPFDSFSQTILTTKIEILEVNFEKNLSYGSILQVY